MGFSKEQRNIFYLPFQVSHLKSDANHQTIAPSSVSIGVGPKHRKYSCSAYR